MMKMWEDEIWLEKQNEYRRLREQSRRTGLSISQQVLKNNLMDYLGKLNQHHTKELTTEVSKLNKFLNDLGKKRKNGR